MPLIYYVSEDKEFLYWISLVVEGSWHHGYLSGVLCVLEHVVSLYEHLTFVVGVFHCRHESVFMVIEFHIGILGVGEVFYGMLSGELSTTSSTVVEVFECGEVKEQDFCCFLFLLWCWEFLWDKGKVTFIATFLENVLS